MKNNKSSCKHLGSDIEYDAKGKLKLVKCSSCGYILIKDGKLYLKKQ